MATKKAFVIMPFDPEFTSIFTDVIRPALEETGFEVIRADSFFDQQNILKDILRGIAEAHLVVADITNLNANVLYELGIAHTLNKPTVLLTQSMETVPFDLRSYRLLVYSIHFQEIAKLTRELREVARRTLEGRIVFGNPVSDFLPAQRSAHVTINPQDVVARTDSAKALTRSGEPIGGEPGFLDLRVELEEASQKATTALTQMTAASKDLGKRLARRTQEMEVLQKLTGPGSAARVRAVVNTVAQEMISYATEIERQSPELHEAWEVLADRTSRLIARAGAKTENERGELLEVRASAEQGQQAFTQMLSAIGTARETAKGTRGISRELDRASERVDSGLAAVAVEAERLQAFFARVITLVDEKLKESPPRLGAD